MEIVTTRNLGTIASSIFRSVSIIIYIILLRLFISSKFLKNKIVAFVLFSRWKVYIFRNKNIYSKVYGKRYIIEYRARKINRTKSGRYRMSALTSFW